MEKENLILCECGSPEHQIIIIKDDEFRDIRMVYLQIHLKTYKNFIKRIWIAIKYICGYKCKYGNWDVIILTTNNYQPLKDAIEFLENKSDLK
jgi:hypothetical protein